MNAAAFGLAVRPLLRRSAAYAFGFLRDRKDAEDAVQQAALQAWARRAQYDPQRAFTGWWFTILRNHCLDTLRARQRAPDAVSSDVIDVPVAADESVLDQIALKAALNKLPEIHRDVLQLRYFGDLGYAEIAQVLDVPQGTVMSRLHVARKALAALITQEGP